MTSRKNPHSTSMWSSGVFQFQDTTFVATCKGGRDAAAPSLPPSRAAAAATASASAAGAVAEAGLADTTQNVSQQPTADLSPFMGFVFPSIPATSCVTASGASAEGIGQGRAGVGPASLSTGLLVLSEENAPEGGGAEESDRPSFDPRTFDHALFSHGLAASSAVAVAPGATSTDNHEQHAHQPSSVNAPEGRQETTAAGCGGARITAAPAAATSQAFLLPLAPFRPPPEHSACASLESSSISKESSSTRSTAVASKSAAAMETSDASDANGNGAESRQHGWDGEVRQ